MNLQQLRLYHLEDKMAMKVVSGKNKRPKLQEKPKALIPFK